MLPSVKVVNFAHPPPSLFDAVKSTEAGPLPPNTPFTISAHRCNAKKSTRRHGGFVTAHIDSPLICASQKICLELLCEADNLDTRLSRDSRICSTWKARGFGPMRSGSVDRFSLTRWIRHPRPLMVDSNPAHARHWITIRFHAIPVYLDNWLPRNGQPPTPPVPPITPAQSPHHHPTCTRTRVWERVQ